MNADDLGKILDELGQRLGPAGEHVYSVLVKQAQLVGAVQLALGMVLVILGMVAVAVITKLAQADQARRADDDYLDSYDPTGYVFVGGLCLFPIGLGVALLALGFLAVFNPEYHAITDLLARLP